MAPVEDCPPGAAATLEAQVLCPPLVCWLQGTQRLREEGSILFEVPWAGRRVDIVTLGKRLRVSAFELKLGRTSRVLEQAIYNRAVFDRSYMVVVHLPRPQTLEDARREGVGIVLVRDGHVRLILESPLVRYRGPARDRLLARLLERRPGNPSS